MISEKDLETGFTFGEKFIPAFYRMFKRFPTQEEINFAESRFLAIWKASGNEMPDKTVPCIRRLNDRGEVIDQMMVDE